MMNDELKFDIKSNWTIVNERDEATEDTNNFFNWAKWSSISKLTNTYTIERRWPRLNSDVLSWLFGRTKIKINWNDTNGCNAMR